MNRYVVFTLLLLLLLLATHFDNVYCADFELLASVSSVSGEVEVKKAGADTWKEAAEGMLLRGGDSIRTKAGGSCDIKWSQGNVISLTPFATLKIDKIAAQPATGAEISDMNLQNGKIYARAKKLSGPGSNFQVRTPTAIAAVRGTKFSAKADGEESSEFECLDGALQVQGASGGDVMIVSGQKTKVAKGKKPEAPSNMTDDDVSAFSSASAVDAPMLDIMQPVGNLESDTTPVTIKGRTAYGNNVRVNGAAVTPDRDGMFTVAVDLEPGTNQVKIDAENKNGNVTTKTRVIKLREKKADSDVSPVDQGNEEAGVRLVVTEPAGLVVTRESTITVSGTAHQHATVETDTGMLLKSPGATSFSGQVPLSEGENVIEITGTWTPGNSGNTKSQSVTISVTKDSIPPILTIIQPNTQFGVGDGTCMLEGSMISCTVIGITEPGVKIRINSSEITVEDDGSFEHQMYLSLDETIITIIAEDAAGNQSATVLTRTIDQDTVAYMTLSVSPESIVADNVSTATLTIKATNLLQQPVTGDVVYISATYGGFLSANSVVLSGGVGSVTFRAGPGSVESTVTFTATTGDVTDTATLLLTPDAPPDR